MDINTMITTYNTAVTGEDGDSVILGKERRKKASEPQNVPDLCGERRDLKTKKRYEAKRTKKNTAKQPGGFRRQ